MRPGTVSVALGPAVSAAKAVASPVGPAVIAAWWMVASGTARKTAWCYFAAPVVPLVTAPAPAPVGSTGTFSTQTHTRSLRHSKAVTNEIAGDAPMWQRSHHGVNSKFFMNA